jgi:hypothetical protein
MWVLFWLSFILMSAVSATEHGPAAAGPFIETSSLVCPNDKSITVCKFYMTTRGHHVKALGAQVVLKNGR